MAEDPMGVRWLARSLGALAAWAATTEVLVAPKPGLVDPLDRGAHLDMDWVTFLHSSSALAPLWEEQAMAGLLGLQGEEALKAMRPVGLRMEEAMFKATGGVNTHKGLIFALSLWLYGAGRCAREGRPPEPKEVAFRAAEPVMGAVDRELRPLKEGRLPGRELTHGERLYLEHGVTGIRGEAEGGFPTVVRHICPTISGWLSRGATLNDASIAGLLAAMGTCQDSNVIHRGGYQLWRGPYREAALRALGEFDPLAGDYSPILRLDLRLKELRVSPGGAADLLACGLFALGLRRHLVDNPKVVYYNFGLHRIDRRGVMS
jgi:triphosphoribosyl-dephospho-CoA synthetase